MIIVGLHQALHAAFLVIVLPHSEQKPVRIQSATAFRESDSLSVCLAVILAFTCIPYYFGNKFWPFLQLILLRGRLLPSHYASCYLAA